jgi:hypothetical protein
MEFDFWIPKYQLYFEFQVLLQMELNLLEDGGREKEREGKWKGEGGREEIIWNLTENQLYFRNL